MEEVPLVDDVEIGSEEEPTDSRPTHLRKFLVASGVLGLTVLAYIGANYDGNENSTKVADTIGRSSNFGQVSVQGGQVQMGDHNAQSNIGGDQTTINNHGNYVSGTNKGNMVGTNYGSISNTVEAKKCEGSGNGVKGVGAAQVVCCYSPTGQGCCGESAVGGRLLASNQAAISQLQDQFLTTSDPDTAKLLLAKIKMLKGSYAHSSLSKSDWPEWASKLPKTSTGGQCPQGSKASK